MIDFEDIKQKAVDVITVLSDKAGEVYTKAEGKTKELAKTTQLSAEVVREKNNIKKLTAELGSLYYQLYKDNPTEEAAQLCAEITAANANIEALQKQIDEIKAAGKCDDVEVEIVTEDDACCCGEEGEESCCDEEKAEESCDCGCQEEKAEEPCDCGCQEEKKDEE
jgi:transposase